MLELLACAAITWHDGDSGRACGERFRLVAQQGPIDAPELQCQPNRWCDDQLAIKARDYVRSLSGMVLHCRGYDRYGRALCRVTVNGRDLGDDLVRRGYAVVRDDWR